MLGGGRRLGNGGRQGQGRPWPAGQGVGHHVHRHRSGRRPLQGLTSVGVQQTAADAVRGLAGANARRRHFGLGLGPSLGLRLGFRLLDNRHRRGQGGRRRHFGLGLGRRLVHGLGLGLGLSLGFSLGLRPRLRRRLGLGGCRCHWSRCRRRLLGWGRRGRLGHLVAHGGLGWRLGCLGRGQSLGNLGHRFDDELVLVLGVVPASIDESEKGQRKPDQPALRHAVLGLRRGEQKPGLGPLSRGFRFVGINRRLAVDAQVLGVGAHETDGIDRARQFGETPLLEGQQVFQADAQCAGHADQIEAVAHARRPEIGADAVISGILEFR